MWALLARGNTMLQREGLALVRVGATHSTGVLQAGRGMQGVLRPHARGWPSPGDDPYELGSPGHSGGVSASKSLDKCVIVCYHYCMNKLKHRFTLILPMDVWERLSTLVKRSRRAVTQEVILAIEERLEREEKAK